MEAINERAKSRRFHHFALDRETPVLGLSESLGALIALEPTNEGIKAHWAADSAADLLGGLRKALASLSRTESYIRVGFIPVEFEETLKREGFVVVSEMLDAWLSDLASLETQPSGRVSVRPVSASDVSFASDITKACYMQSRDFFGEEPEFVRKWIQNDHNTALLAIVDGKPVGVLLASLYGFDSPKGPVCFIREMAVRPEWQGRGIGRDLLLHGLQWGKTRGATRSFLHVDVENKPAIGLYESVGYELVPGRGEINMAARAIIQESAVRFEPK